jgi:hypothetical protein
MTAEYRRLISAWLALYLEDPSSTPELMEWIKTLEGQLARKLAQSSPEQPKLRLIQEGLQQ